MADTKSTRSVQEIEADLAANRDRLARTVDELAVRLKPAELKRRAVEELKAKKDEKVAALRVKADEQVTALKAKKGEHVAALRVQKDGRVTALRTRASDTAYTPEGDVRYDRVAAGLGGVSAVTLLLGLARRTFYRG